jgi:hypothetical protein
MTSTADTSTSTTDATAVDRQRLSDAGRIGDHLAQALASAGRAMAVLLGDVEATLRMNVNDPDGPTDNEQAAAMAADTLARSARRLLDRHRIGDGHGIADFARACLAYAASLHVAAAGRWPADLDAIHAAMRSALRDVENDTRVTAKGALRSYALEAERLRATGPAGATLAGRIDHECRHALAELQRIAAAPATTTTHAFF